MFLDHLDRRPRVAYRRVRHRSASAPCGSSEGALWGRILESPQGEAGFGYDPVFYVPELGQSYAEMALAEKNQVSHRAARFAELLAP